MKEVRDYDHQHLQYLQGRGYNVEIIWESNWNTFVENRPEIKTYISQICTSTHFKKILTQDQIIQYIKDGHLFGFVECDIHTPEHLKDYFSEMTPIFKKYRSLFKIQVSKETMDACL